jgi:hypothetical protein
MIELTGFYLQKILEIASFSLIKIIINSFERINDKKVNDVVHQNPFFFTSVSFVPVYSLRQKIKKMSRKCDKGKRV